jgi:dienelactone hydrolase
LAPRAAVRSLLTVLLLWVGSVTLAACSPAAGGTHGAGVGASSTNRLGSKRAGVKPPANFGVGLGLVTWDETQGYTENFYTGTTTRGRFLKVEILYPTLSVKAPAVKVLAAPAYRFGPYPVVVFAHGYDVDPDTYRALLDSWAEAGYVVVAPFFPDTSLGAVAAQHGEDAEADIFNQPADVLFVMSQVVKAAEGSPLTRIGYMHGMMNPARLILAGQSDGGDTIAALMYDHAYAATRASMPVKPLAVALLSAGKFLRAEDVYSAPAGAGALALVVQSLTDACNDPSNSSQLYNMLKGPKWFIALTNATHLGPYVGLGVAASVVEQATVAFFDLATGRPRASPSLLHEKGDRTGVSTISSAASVPLYPAPAPVADACSLPPGAPTD